MTPYRHLLGKKSWNVYNTANIERVKRDEEAAAAREAAEEQRTQEVDAERRMRLLRGLPVEDLAAPEEAPKGAPRRERRVDHGPSCKRRRINGEDDTARDIRYAKEDQELAAQRAEAAPLRKPRHVPLTDAKGNIDLFAAEGARKQKTRNKEAAAEEAKKKRELEDQYTMRFSNAAGFKQTVGKKPWYSTGAGRPEENEKSAVGKDVWGNEHPRRRERDQQRIAADDPLAAMHRGVQGVRQVEKERRDWEREKEREIRDLEKEEERTRRRERRSKNHEDEDLDNFRLDGGPAPDLERHSRDNHRHRHRSRHGRHESHGPGRKHHRSHSERTSEARAEPNGHGRHLIGTR